MDTMGWDALIISPVCRRIERQLIRAPKLMGGGLIDSLTRYTALLARGAIEVDMRTSAEHFAHRQSAFGNSPASFSLLFPLAPTSD